ncbi:serine/Threonine protein kinase with TPR repeats [Geminocystis sp. NIES-3708]|uniref:serine/threonine-protein kinase n=1 Tax=Geminocystis sp. NIES-3708 TaxID=1615909 RepID=UPI0005FCD05E|nr:serine/threonine-protein kinase [Geminocystis sp. NIES-3708]BAQ60130.1 serine/Threonine protein kinase with TPR repeats [Geminocystis sp. NIES-3708]
MTIQCPACLENNPISASHCQICGYSLVSDNDFKNQGKTVNKTNNSPHHLLPNTLLFNGRYQILETIGEGGFGITYKGIYLANQSIVAIKELWPEKSARVDNNIIWSFNIPPKEKQLQIYKFKLEADNQKKCNHPNIPKIYDCFEENNTAYIVMEFIEGKSLLSILKNEGVLSESRIKKYFIQIAEALTIIHQNNFLHRDIKPENIIINSQDKAILIDFGATKEFIDGMTSIMSTTLTFGYAPYEQYSTKSKRFAATDFYALCASMYELLTGKLPEDAAERVDSILHNNGKDPLISPRQLRPEISFLIENIILTGMRIKVEERFQTAQELIKALQGNFLSPLHKKAQDFLNQNNLIESIKAYENCLQNEPNNDQAMVELALVQLHINPQQAEITANQVIKLNPSDGRSYGVLGLMACRQKNWQKAVSDLKKASQLSPQQGWIKSNLAWSLGKLGKWGEAETFINQALSFDGNCTFSLGVKAWILTQQQQWKQAISPATQAIFKSKQSNNRNSKELQTWLYPVLIFALKHAVITKNAQDVEKKINDFCQQIPDSGYSWALKAWHCGKEGKLNEGINYCQKATSFSNFPHWILINQAIIQENLHQRENALNSYRQYSQKFNDYYLVYFRLGTLFANQKQWLNAESYLEKAIKLNPDYAPAYHNLAWVLFNIRSSDGDIENSRQVMANYRQAISLYSANNSMYSIQLKKLFDDLKIKI